METPRVTQRNNSAPGAQLKPPVSTRNQGANPRAAWGGYGKGPSSPHGAKPRESGYMVAT
jgi:hypothetical protein